MCISRALCVMLVKTDSPSSRRFNSRDTLDDERSHGHVCRDADISRARSFTRSVGILDHECSMLESMRLWWRYNVPRFARCTQL